MELREHPGGDQPAIKFSDRHPNKIIIELPVGRARGGKSMEHERCIAVQVCRFIKSAGCIRRSRIRARSESFFPTEKIIATRCPDW